MQYLVFSDMSIVQIEGAFVQGIGFFMLEEYLTNSDGLVVSEGTWTYKIPTIDTIPKQLNVEKAYGNKTASSVPEVFLQLKSSLHFCISKSILGTSPSCPARATSSSRPPRSRRSRARPTSMSARGKSYLAMRSASPGLGRRGQDATGNSLLKAEKLVEIPYIADENADEDPDVTVTLKNDGSIGKRLKEAFLAKGKAFVLEQVRVFVVAMAKGGPAKEELRARCSRRRRQRKPQP
ncbi:hypothetical protein RJ640_000353 [Escallonia rubra]|uniref:Uncharacterized protein n=1 Tax=Escallonia rubra TaxID=112253 RepID=A0AA88QSM0_9ASTE|nr:hypothetical protein RJ640_000353 [Escallonia rubra]